MMSEPYPIQIQPYKDRVDFIRWCMRKNIKLSKRSFINIAWFRQVQKPVSSFKSRATEIKSKYNHKFKPEQTVALLGKNTLARHIVELLTKQS